MVAVDTLKTLLTLMTLKTLKTLKTGGGDVENLILKG